MKFNIGDRVRIVLKQEWMNIYKPEEVRLIEASFAIIKSKEENKILNVSSVDWYRIVFENPFLLGGRTVEKCNMPEDCLVLVNQIEEKLSCQHAISSTLIYQRRFCRHCGEWME